MKLNDRAKIVHQANIKWWEDIDTGAPIKRNKWELLALAVSEVAECLEGERKGLMDDKLPHRKMAEVEMADTYIRLLDVSAGFNIILTEHTWDRTAANKGEALFAIMDSIIGVSLSRAIAQIIAYCQTHGYDLEGAYEEKMRYNATRIDHTHEARKIAGGKQF